MQEANKHTGNVPGKDVKNLFLKVHIYSKQVLIWPKLCDGANAVHYHALCHVGQEEQTVSGHCRYKHQS